MPGRDAALLSAAGRAIQEAVTDLRARGLPADDLDRVLGAVRREVSSGSLPDHVVPRFIPNDLARCGPTTVVNCSGSDHELDLPAGFAMEVSATRPDRFALPYYPDPGLGRLAADIHADRASWTYALSFVGQRGIGDPAIADEPLRDPRTTRSHFLRAFTREFVPAAGVPIRVRVNPSWSAMPWRRRWPGGGQGDGGRPRAVEPRRAYVESLADSRFVLCPRGVGANSIRFFETLALGNVPVYVGGRETRFPLDWIVDWDRACFRICTEEVVSGACADRLRAILATPLDELNRRRRYLFGIHHQFLAPERRGLLDHLVLLRARELLRERTGAARIAAGDRVAARAARPRTRPARTLEHAGSLVVDAAVGDLDGVPVIATAHDDGVARVWDAACGRLLRMLTGHEDSVVGIALDGSGLVATAGGDGVAHLWDARRGERLHALEGHLAPLGAVAIGAFGGRRVVATAGADLTARLWDARSGDCIAVLEGHGAAIWGVALGELDGRPVVATASDDRSARLWDASDGRTLLRLTGHEDLVGAVALGEVDGRPVVATASDDRTTRLWDARGGRSLRVLRHPAMVRGVTVGRLDGLPVAVTGCADGSVGVWDARTGRALRALDARRAVRGVALGMVAGRPVVVSAGGEVHVWEAGTDASC